MLPRSSASVVTIESLDATIFASKGFRNGHVLGTTLPANAVQLISTRVADVARALHAAAAPAIITLGIMRGIGRDKRCTQRAEHSLSSKAGTVDVTTSPNSGSQRFDCTTQSAHSAAVGASGTTGARKGSSLIAWWQPCRRGGPSKGEALPWW